MILLVWDLYNFTPLIPYDVFWKHVHKAFELANYECKLNLRSFNESVQKVYNELYK